MQIYVPIIVLAMAAGGIAAGRPAGSRSWTDSISAAASPFVRLVEWFGELGRFWGGVARASLTRPFEFRELDSAPTGFDRRQIAAAGGAGRRGHRRGASLQTRDSLARFGAKSMLPAVIIFSLIKETGPTITGLVVAGRVGAGIGAELGSMKVTEQIDAMEASAVDPYKFLAATRILACILTLPLLTMAADFFGILMGWVSDTLAEPISLRFFINTRLERRHVQRLLPTDAEDRGVRVHHRPGRRFQGMRTTVGRKAWGDRATSAVVMSSLFIILADVVLVRLIIVFFPS